MRIRSFTEDCVEEIVATVDKALQDSFSPTLGIVFSSPRIGIEELSRRLGGQKTVFFGCSTDGEILASGEEQAVYDGSAAVLLMEMDPTLFRVKLFDGHGETSGALGAKVGAWGKSVFADPCFLLLSASLSADGQEIIKGVLGTTSGETPVYGGLAGDDKAFKQTFVFTNGECTDNGVCALVFDGTRIEMGGIASSGWVGIGAEKTITKASGNVLYTIDNEPALEVYKKYLSIEDDELPQVGVDYPLMLSRDDGSSALRAVMGVDKVSGSLTFAGTVPEGSKVRFSSSTGSDVIERVKMDLDAYREAFPKADVLILFSCMARHLSLGPMVDEEILVAQQKWNAPLIGFFSYGEMGRNATGKCDFYNQTFTLAALKVREG
jgi:hypothetical protein